MSKCQFQSCLADALEDCPNVPGKVSTFVCCNPNIGHILSTLVSFDNWFQGRWPETWKNRHIPAENLCMSFLGKISTKTEGKRLHWPLVLHLQTVMCLGAVDLAEDRLLCLVLCFIWRNADWMFEKCYILPRLGCWFSSDPQRHVVFRWGFSVQKGDLRSWRKTVLWWSQKCASELAHRLSLLPCGFALVGFGCKQIFLLSVWFSSWTPCSSQHVFGSRQKYRGTQPDYFPQLVSQIAWALYQSNQNVQGILFWILYCLVDWASLFVTFLVILWGVVSVLGYDPRLYQVFFDVRN